MLGVRRPSGEGGDAKFFLIDPGGVGIGDGARKSVASDLKLGIEVELFDEEVVVNDIGAHTSVWGESEAGDGLSGIGEGFDEVASDVEVEGLEAFGVPVDGLGVPEDDDAVRGRGDAVVVEGLEVALTSGGGIEEGIEGQAGAVGEADDHGALIVGGGVRVAIGEGSEVREGFRREVWELWELWEGGGR